MGKAEPGAFGSTPVIRSRGRGPQTGLGIGWPTSLWGQPCRPHLWPGVQREGQLGLRWPQGRPLTPPTPFPLAISQDLGRVRSRTLSVPQTLGSAAPQSLCMRSHSACTQRALARPGQYPPRASSPRLLRAAFLSAPAPPAGNSTPWPLSHALFSPQALRGWQVCAASLHLGP